MQFRDKSQAATATNDYMVARVKTTLVKYFETMMLTLPIVKKKKEDEDVKEDEG
jgi:hypothetical protein